MSGSTPPPSGLGNGNVPVDKASILGKALPHVDLDGHDLPPSPAPSSPRNGRRYALATELVYTEGSDQYNASSVPIYQVRRIPRSMSHLFSVQQYQFSLISALRLN